MISQRLSQLEKEIALLLIEKLEHQQITLERAAEISRFIIISLPDNLTDKQVDDILPTLDDHFIELAAVVNKHLDEKMEIEKKSTIDDATKLIHQGKLDEAVKMMNNHITKK